MNLANKITIARILLVPLFVLSFIYYDRSVPILRALPLVIFCVATLSDALDGAIARGLHQRTELGAILDPLADKLLLVTAFICLYRSPGIEGRMHLPAWVAVVIISRDAILVLGSALIHIITGKLRVIPSLLGKITTVLQMATVFAIFLQLAISPLIWNLAALCTVLSGVDYIRKGSRMLNGATR